MSALVLREDRDAIATLTLNRPEKLNALSPDLLIALGAQIDTLASEAGSISCIVLRGAGRSFCAGADIEALKSGVVTKDPDMRSKTIERLGQLPQAVIAAVHGHCYTGGMELALAADIIVASDDARFCDTHARLGIVPRWGMSVRLPRRVGLAAAKLLSFTALPIDAAEALRLGLCDRVVPREQLQPAAAELAATIAGNSGRSIRGIKHLYEKGAALQVDEALAYERTYSTGVYPHSDE